jgi:cathepsin C
LLAVFLAVAKADLPVHCVYEQVHGSWEFRVTADGKSRSVPLTTCVYNKPLTEATTSISIELQGPNIALNHDTGAKGTWTMIYDQGFEVVFEDRKYFAFFNFTKSGSQVISHCGETTTGWYHENAVAAKNWGCFKGVKKSQSTRMNPIREVPVKELAVDAVFQNDHRYIDAINAAQSSWVAGPAPFEGMKWSDLIRFSGKKMPAYRREAHKNHHVKMQSMYNFKANTKGLPENWDWRNETCGSAACVTPVRNQASCGSCFAFASMGMFEARARIESKGRVQTIFSPQDDLSCDPYNQACNGGFTYSVSKYGQDYGIAPETCSPYKGYNTPCDDKCPPSQRVFVRDYQYVGGYYGGSNEENMMEAIYNNGPVTVDFMVYSDFYYYRGGVYHHTKKLDQYVPDPHFVEVNHAVLCVGWGVSPQGEKYWIVKNSWGASWGMGGYFLIRRGTDECGIESGAVQAFLNVE